MEEQTTGTTAGGAENSTPPDEGQPAGTDAAAPQQPTSFASRGRARRRARYLRKARELAYRDLGGLVFNLHRFGQRNDALVLAKLTTLEQIDGELRATEAALGEAEPLTVLREAGITACARCAAIHSSEDRFCPNCGLSLGPHAERPAELRTGAPAHVSAAVESPPAAVAPVPPPQPDAVPAPQSDAASAPLPQPETAPAGEEASAEAVGGESRTVEARAEVDHEQGQPEPQQTRELDHEATVIMRPSAPGA